ncbi:YicC/YloC family endoribonuclease [Pseudobythopirellula maris]|uniref:YicC/YloC family endoribonuclease n=1 Tax=Pseudobythopirellula maris TaxID=2527991 RepID=UPI001E2CD3C9|nr:YicC/YloC family endoribonuclease [Pseudobythopirellula maris]
MIVSMTGFGEGRAESDTIAVTAEVRAINNRHLKINYRSSDGYHGLEPQVEALVRKLAARGTVTVNVRVERKASADDYHLNAAVLKGYQRQLGELCASGETPRIEALLTLPGVVDTPDAAAADAEADWPVIKKALESALDAFGSMRKSEGQALAVDLGDNCTVIHEQLTGVEERAPMVVDGYRDRLQDRVAQSLEKLGVTVEPADLVREVAFFADRSDISEEIVRLKSHIEQFRSTIAKGENCGRKLEFIAQEMGRETNTIGSKANDTDISHRVVEMKAALERIREQVQNVE